MPNALRLEQAAISQQRIEDAGEAAGEGDAATCLPRRAAMRRAQVRSSLACGGRRRSIETAA